MKIRVFLLYFLIFVVLNLFSFTDEIIIFATSNTKGILDLKNNSMAKRINILNMVRRLYQNVVIFDLGNIASPSFESYQENGKPAFYAYSLANYDAINLGKREFDYGINVLKEAIDKLPIISANVDIDDLKIKRYLIKNNVFITGLCSKELLDEIPQDIKDKVKFTSYLEALFGIIDKAKSIKNIKYKILLTNLNLDEILKLSDIISFFDIVLLPKNKNIDSMRIKNSRCIFIENGIKNITTILVDNKFSTIKSLSVKNYLPDNRFLDFVLKNKKKVKDYNICYIKELEEFERIICNILRKHFGADISFLNRGLFRKRLNSNNLSYSNFLQIFPFRNRIYSFKIKGSLLKSMYKRSKRKTKDSRKLIWAGLNEKNNKLYVNDFLLKDNETYHAVTIEYLKNGGDGYIELSNLSVYKDEKQTFKDIVLNYLKKQKEVSINDFDYYNRLIKRSQKTTFDFSFTSIDYNSNKSFYENKNIREFSDDNKQFFQGVIYSDILVESKDHIKTINLKIQFEKEKNNKGSSKIEVIGRKKFKNAHYNHELKLNTSWNKLKNDRYPCILSYSYLRSIYFIGYKEFLMGLSVKNDFANNISTGGFQIYLNKNWEYNINSKLDIFQGLMDDKETIIELESRFYTPLKGNLNYFFTHNLYLYKDDDIKKWGCKNKFYSGFSIYFNRVGFLGID